MFSNLDRKETSNNTSPPNIKSDDSIFRPLSPFSAKDIHERHYSLPGWILPGRQHGKSQDPSKYNFEWLKNSKTTNEKPHENLAISNSIDNRKELQSTNDTQHKSKQTFSSSVVTSGSTSAGASIITESGSASAIEILRNARTMAREGNLDEAMGNYISLVKSSEKLKQVVDDLEKLVSNPRIKQSPAMIQALADAYTKTGKFAKALPLYRKALGR